MSHHIPPKTESVRRRRTSDYISQEPPNIAAEPCERDLLEKRHIPWERYEREHVRRRRPNYDDSPRELRGREQLSERDHMRRRRPKEDDIPREEFKRESVGRRRKSSEHIPQELLIEILKRLSPRELVRFTSVSKSWYSLITSPYFVSFHTHQSAATNNDLLLVRTCSEKSKREHYSIHLDNDTFDDWKRLDFPLNSVESCFRVISCLNGVICLSDDLGCNTGVMILWNPSIRKFVPLPSFIRRGLGMTYMQAFGFGFIATTNDYKVVRLVYLEGHKGSSEAPPLVEVYQLSIGSWRYVDSKGFPYIVDQNYSEQAFLNGTIHWIGSMYRRFNSVVVTFDVEMEEFGVIKLPLDIPAKEQFIGQYRVAVFGEDFLSLIHCPYSGRRRNMCDIWVMKQYGVVETWTKYYSVALPGNYPTAFGFRKDGKILVRTTKKRSALITFDPSGMQVEDHGVRGRGEYVFVGKFVESLSLLGVRGDSNHLLPRRYLKERSKSRR